MRRTVLTLIAALSCVSAGRAQAPTEFVGKIEPELVPGRIATGLVLTPASDEARQKLGAMAASGDEVFTGDVVIGETKRSVFLVASGADSRAIVTDINGNGTFESTEKFAMTTSAESGMAVDVLLQFSAPAGATFPRYPVRVGLGKSVMTPPVAPAPKDGVTQPRRWNLGTSYQAFAKGVVVIDGKPTMVQINASSKDLKVDPSKGYQYLDCNGDGAFDQDFTSWEMGYGRGSATVFHVGDGPRYVSIKSVDPATATITLSARPAADYERIELRLGATLPDFAFKTLDGTSKKLSDFRGKYLLIDFWGTWCGPCVGEIPFLKKVYETYKDKGFEVLGMDNELPDVTADDFAKGLVKVKEFVAKEGVTWTQAQTESIKPLYEKRFQIVAWPTMILLDRDGKILSVDRTSKGEAGLRGEKLAQTIEDLFKK